MTNLLATNSLLTKVAGSAIVTKLLSYPIVLKGTIGGLALTAAGFAVIKMSNTKKGIELRKKLVSNIRDKADKAIESLDMAAQELEDIAKKPKKNSRQTVKVRA